MAAFAVLRNNVFEAEPSGLFAKMGPELRFQVVCSERAGHLDEEIPYGFVVSFETAAEVPIYHEIRERLQASIATQARVRVGE